MGGLGSLSLSIDKFVVALLEEVVGLVQFILSVLQVMYGLLGDSDGVLDVGG